MGVHLSGEVFTVFANTTEEKKSVSGEGLCRDLNQQIAKTWQGRYLDLSAAGIVPESSTWTQGALGRM